MSQNGNGGVCLVVCLALVFVTARVERAPHLGKLRYHALRIWGIHTTPPPEVVDDAIDRAADEHGIPRKLFRALVHVESRKNPNAVSPKGATGLSQIMPANSRRCGLSSARQLEDVIFNARCGAQILAEELTTYGGNVTKALKAYNGGPKCVNGGCKESDAYALRVLSIASRG